MLMPDARPGRLVTRVRGRDGNVREHVARGVRKHIRDTAEGVPPTNNATERAIRRAAYGTTCTAS